MDIPETLETLGTQETGRRQTKQKQKHTQQRKLNRFATRTPPKTRMNPGAQDMLGTPIHKQKKHR